MRRLKNRTSQKGFTIIEFMVATLVFSVVLMGVTAAILEITRIYQRSLNDSATQAAARNLVDSTAQAIQFSSGGVQPSVEVGDTKGYCVGNREFLYVLGRKINSSPGSTNTQHAVVTRTNSGCQGADIVSSTPSGGAIELLSTDMRLSRLTIQQQGNLYTITARVVYGADDLLCSPSIAGSCENPNGVLTPAQFASQTDLRCKAIRGSHFCSVSELSTTVQGRL